MHLPGSQLMLQVELFKTQLRYFTNSAGSRSHGTLDDESQAEPKEPKVRQEKEKTQKMSTYGTMSSRPSFKELCRTETMPNSK